MCTRLQCLSKLSKAAPFIKNEYGVSSLCLFGSMARGDNKENSDVDVCVEMPPKAFKVIALKNYLQDLLGVNVDVVRKNPQMDIFLIKEIERDAIYIFS